MLCIERLSHGICNVVNAGEWKPICLSCKGTPLTHLFLADDLLLFAEASPNQAKIINIVLDDCCCSSREKVYRIKTNIFYSFNVSMSVARSIGKTFGFTIINNLGRYLGMLFLHSRVTKSTYQEIMDKVEKRLSTWNASYISLTGCRSLSQSVLQAILIYVI